MENFFENLLSNGELQAEIAELKAYKDVNEDFKTAWEELKAENEKLKALCDTYKTCHRAKHNDIDGKLFKYHKTLQEIKKYIAKICKEECGYVQKKRCPDCDCRYGAILDLITKAEEE